MDQSRTESIRLNAGTSLSEEGRPLCSDFDRAPQSEGDGQIIDDSQLPESLYAELRGLATAYLSRESNAQSLQPTALVHEAFLKLASLTGDAPSWHAPRRFFALAALAMRRILVDHARRRAALKRNPSEHVRVTTGDETTVPAVDVVVLDDALDRLALFDPRAAQLVTLRFFAGLSVEEAAVAMCVSTTTAERDWRAAKAWLIQELG
jgi:RNA polymerase sigma factor (TIGR02999 family)